MDNGSHNKHITERRYLSTRFKSTTLSHRRREVRERNWNVAARQSFSQTTESAIIKKPALGIVTFSCFAIRKEFDVSLELSATAQRTEGPSASGWHIVGTRPIDELSLLPILLPLHFDKIPGT